MEIVKVYHLKLPLLRYLSLDSYMYIIGSVIHVLVIIHVHVVTQVLFCDSRLSKHVKRYAHEVIRGHRTKRSSCADDLSETSSDRFESCEVC